MRRLCLKSSFMISRIAAIAASSGWGCWARMEIFMAKMRRMLPVNFLVMFFLPYDFLVIIY